MRFSNSEDLNQDSGMTAHPPSDLIDLITVNSFVIPDMILTLADVAVTAADTLLATLVCGPNYNLPSICPLLQFLLASLLTDSEI